MANIKSGGHIWGPGFNRYACFLFHGNQTIFSWDIANSIFDLENSRSMSRWRWIWLSHLRHRVQLICLLFVALQSDHFWPRHSWFHIWPWKFKVKVITKVRCDGHIWDLEFNWYVCILCHGNWTIFLPRYTEFHIRPGQFKVKITTKMDQNLIRWPRRHTNLYKS